MDGSHTRQFFLEPQQTSQRQYEALRAIFVDDEPLERVAERFGYKPATLRSLASRLRVDYRRGVATPFFSPTAADGPSVPVRAKDSTAFIVNRLLVPYLLDAIRVYEGGLATLEDIDQAMKLGCGYPMGPFTLLDLVGLDTTMYVAEVMFEEFRDPRYAPPPLLKRMVMAGRLGRKAGRGFHDYSAK